MSKTGQRKSLVRVKKSFNTTCFISFAAPYSLSEDVSLPEGMVMSLVEDVNKNGETWFQAAPLDPEAWAPFLLSATHRFDKNFRGSYFFSPSTEEVTSYFDELTEAPAERTGKLRIYHAIQGCLFGTAVADAIGLPYEGLSPRRIAKMKVFPLRHRFFFGRGMLSDDTEHTCMVADSLIYSEGSTDKFAKLLACTMRLWFLGLPAGIGMATLRACLKLWVFIPPDKSGVFSAGNGPAMRSAIIGAYASDNKSLRQELISICTRITHTDPKALKGAMIVAEMTARNTEGQPLNVDNCLEVLSEIIDDDEELLGLVSRAIDSARNQQSAEQFCQQENLGKGVSGYIFHTLPVVIQIVLRHNQNYEEAISEAVRCGGDTDTVAAIIGGIVGAAVGKKGIPEDWLVNLKDWPRDKTYIQLLGDELARVRYDKDAGRSQWMDFIRLLLRNTFFMVWVLAHGFRRLLPPY